MNGSNRQHRRSRTNEIINATLREKRTRERLFAFEQELFREPRRYLVLFLTLNYRSEYHEDITLRTIQRHRDTFLKRIEEARDGVLSEIQACIWKLEEGSSAGLHLHCLIFFSGRHCADTYYAEQIGEYWVTSVTRGWGEYWNSNTKRQKASYEQKYGNCLGQVNTGDEQKRESLRRFISAYFAKQTQVPAGRGPHDRTWGARSYD